MVLLEYIGNNTPCQHKNCFILKYSQATVITVIKSYNTAITRTKLSTPTTYLVEHQLLVGKILDYGCGKGFDAIQLKIDRFDPYHYRTDRKKIFATTYDTIYCNYVLNVITEPEATQVLEKIKNLLSPNGKAYISVRRDIEGEYATSKNTYQRKVILDYPTITKNNNFEMYLVTK